MRQWPRSLFGRTALVITTLVVLSQLLSAALLYFYYIGPRTERAAHATSIEIRTLMQALRLIPASQKERFIRELEKEQNIHILADKETPGGMVLNTYAIRNFEQRLSQQLEQPIETRWQHRMMWVRWRGDGSAVWIGLPRTPVERDLYWPVAGWLLLGGLLGLLGALWITRRINRPLRALSQAAALLGSGKIPHDLPETGATEIATLSLVFNQMARDVQRLSADRTLLLAGVSHDLRTPLSRLRLALEMLGNNTDAMLKQGMVQDIDDIDGIVEQFLAYVRDGEVETVRLADMNELVQTTATRYLRQGQALVLDLMPVPTLPLRVVAIQRLLANLIDNALRHGGGDIKVCTQELDGCIRLPRAGSRSRSPHAPA